MSRHLAEVGRVTPCAPLFALQEIVVAAVGAQRTARPTFRFMESLHGFLTAHRDLEPSAERVGAPASWTAATESSQSPLWVGVAVSAARFGILSAARIKAVTSQTPSPHSKTWRQNDRFMERDVDLIMRSNRCRRAAP